MHALFSSRRAGLIGLLAAIVVGAVLRSLWPMDIEYKGDQVYTFEVVETFWKTGVWPILGMTSSVGPSNPGMSQWVFIALSVFVPRGDPVALTQAVECVNIIAIVALALFAWKCIGIAEREPWLWSAALVAVNPFAIHFSRCIWQMNLLPIFLVGFLAGWWYRRRWWGAFIWGVIGAILGQIHMPAYFFAAAFFLVIVLFDRRSTHWIAWFSGSVLGALPMIPWLMALASTRPPVSDSSWSNVNPAFLLHWLNMATGVGLEYSLGNDFTDFLTGPSGTHLAVACGAAIVLIVAAIGARFALRLFADRSAVASYFTQASPTAVILFSASIGYGLLLLSVRRPIYLHYFVIAFSLPALSIAWLAYAGGNARRLLAALVVAQAALSGAFLAYIHDRQVIDGDYGAVYGASPLAVTPAH